MNQRDDRRPTHPHTGQPLPDEALDALERPVRDAPGQPVAPLPGEAPGGGTGASGAGSGAADGSGTAGRPADASGPAREAPSPGAPTAAAGSPEAAPSQQELAVRSALETVMDPEIGLSVIDLGLIREIHFLPDKTFVRMMLTTPFCPYAPQLMEEVKQATTSVVPLPCEVEIMPDAWSPDLMPDPGLLGYSF